MGGKKRKLVVKEESSSDEESVDLPPPTRFSDEPIPKKTKWINKQRVLVFAARGISYRHRHLLMNLRTLMPHHRPENKFERKEDLSLVNEICEMKNCNKAILLEGRLHRDLYMWLANVPAGPSAKFLVENIHTMGELKLTGNCLMSSRPLLSFDKGFDEEPHYKLLKEIIIQIFGVPNGHPKSQPFIDHVLTFSIMDNRIWYRNYQILSEDGALAEIGPRFVLNPIKIFDGSFGGNTLWENPHYVSPGKFRKLINKNAAAKYENRVGQKTHNELNRPETTYALSKIDDMFDGDAFETAKQIVEKEEEMRKIAEEFPAEEKPERKPKKKVPKPAVSRNPKKTLPKPAISNGQSPKGNKVNGSTPSKSPGGKKNKNKKKIKNPKVAAIKLKQAKAKAAKSKAAKV